MEDVTYIDSEVDPERAILCGEEDCLNYDETQNDSETDFENGLEADKKSVTAASVFGSLIGVIGILVALGVPILIIIFCCILIRRYNCTKKE